MSEPASTASVVDQINDLCFNDDPDFATDADRDSKRLMRLHQQLWSKPLPSGGQLDWTLEPGSSCLVHGDIRVSSDTIATTHSNDWRLGVAQ